MICPTCGGAMLTERPHRHSATDRTPTTAACLRCDKPMDHGTHDTFETCEEVRGPCLDRARHHPFMTADRMSERATWLKWPPFVLWIADRDGLAHARSKSGATRTVCGIVAIDRRYAWPPTGRCLDCMEATRARTDR